jgi:hypothetical protein
MSYVTIGELKNIDIDWQSFGDKIDTFSVTLTFTGGARLQDFFDRKTAVRLRNKLNVLLNKRSKRAKKKRT